VAAVVAGCSLWLFGLTLWSHAKLEKSNPRSNPDVVSPHALVAVEEEEEVSILQDLWPDDHDAEEFVASLRSCTDDCLGEPRPQPQRVGLLYPPGDFGLIFVDFIQATAKTHAPHTRGEILWEPTSHLPSDATNRYSHVVRFAVLPLILAAGDALLQYSDPNEISWQDIPETVELLLRWHCELSNLVHPGSSYPLMTITMEQIEEDAIQQSFMLVGFVDGLEPNDDDDGEMDPNFENPLVNRLHEIVNRVKPLLQRLDGDFTKEGSTNSKDKNLEGMVVRIIQNFLVDDVKCPKEVPPMQVPVSDAARAVYESLKPLPVTRDPHRHDEERCTEDNLSKQRFCQRLPKGYDTKSLIRFLYEQGKEKESQQNDEEGEEDGNGDLGKDGTTKAAE